MNQLHVKMAALILGVMMAVGTAYAETVKGTVKEVDPQAKYVTLNRDGNAGEVKIDVDSTTQFGGVPSIQGLKVGSEVTVEANAGAAAGQWKAKAIMASTPSGTGAY